MFVASATVGANGDIRVDATGGLRDAISVRADNVAQLQGDVNDLTALVEAQRALADPGPALAATQAQIDALAPAVGLTEVVGPGVRVTLNDATPPDPLPDGFTNDDYVVHQQDVQGVVNALWRGGASGVTVMGQRLVSTSAVRCVGNTVILQGRVFSPPFVIEGVGDVGALVTALDQDQSVGIFREWVDLVGLGYQQQALPQLVLPAYTGPLAPQYADPVRG